MSAPTPSGDSVSMTAEDPDVARERGIAFAKLVEDFHSVVASFAPRMGEKEARRMVLEQLTRDDPKPGRGRPHGAAVMDGAAILREYRQVWLPAQLTNQAIGGILWEMGLAASPKAGEKRVRTVLKEAGLKNPNKELWGWRNALKKAEK